MNDEASWGLFFDGLCEPNPHGVMSWGWVLFSPDGRNFTGRGATQAKEGNSNNIAEYAALEAGIRALLKLIEDGEACSKIAVRGDSKLVVEQISGRWRCNAPHLVEHRDRCKGLLSLTGATWAAEHVRRIENERADELSRMAYTDLTGQPVPEHFWEKARAR